MFPQKSGLSQYIGYVMVLAALAFAIKNPAEAAHAINQLLASLATFMDELG
ncbi:hypothetical protein [Actinomadura chibensis]|uniref:hypothetical protein n=1 Tax=Actinomadura chibensis TaxID=392828 RepID=UPI000AE3CA9F|nr:hypothetical protein [Actinomadura chibensis]